MSVLRPGPLAGLVAALLAVFLLMPLVAVIPVSFTPTRFPSIPTDALSVRHYRALVENPAWAQGAWLSIRIGLVAAAISTVLAAAFAIGIWMFRPRFGGVLMGLAYDRWGGVVLAHVVMVSPFAVVLISVGLAQIDRRIDLAARSMGAGLGTRIFRVILPNIRFSLIAALFLTFVLSWEEIAVTLFITSVEAITLPRLMWMGLRDNIDPAIAAISA